MKRTILVFAVVPGLVALVITLARARLEVTDPTGALTKALGINVPLLVVLLLWPALLMRRGLSFGQFMVVVAVLLVCVRGPVAGVYTMAWADDWRVEGTNEPVRYVRDFTDAPGDRAMARDEPAAGIFVPTFAFPTLAGLVLSFVVWVVTWAVAFRRRRPLFAAPA